MRTVVAMSGGVDSTVAAALLAEAGREVIGLSMQLYDRREGEAAFGGCCTLDDLHDARRAARQIGIPHYIVNFERPFEDRVIANFVREYLDGRTPIPCTRCNSDVKFATLLERTEALDASNLATGHYAGVEYDQTRDVYRLRRGADPGKDQAYFLFSLTQPQLARAVFPVGHLAKSEVRRYARERGLVVADKPDSHEICFVPDNDYAAFIERRTGDATPRSGVVRDVAGKVMATHTGVHRFTVGQRKGLGVAAGTPLYVLRLEPGTQTVIVGERSQLERSTFEVEDVNWIEGTPSGAIRAAVQVRHRHAAAPATVSPTGDTGATVRFDESQMAVAPGQAAVFYDGDYVLGGGWIGSDPAES